MYLFIRALTLGFEYDKIHYYSQRNTLKHIMNEMPPPKQVIIIRKDLISVQTLVEQAELG